MEDFGYFIGYNFGWIVGIAVFIVVAVGSLDE